MWGMSVYQYKVLMARKMWLNMQDDYLKRITNYIFDNRFSRALLIDGDWGCGKSFFVKNILIPELENTKVKEKKGK